MKKEDPKKKQNPHTEDGATKFAKLLSLGEIKSKYICTGTKTEENKTKPCDCPNCKQQRAIRAISCLGED